MNKNKALAYIRKYGLITIGCFLLAFGDAAFLSPLNIVTGGVLSMGIIVQHFVGPSFYVVDIVVWAAQVALLGFSFAFLGTRFTIRSLFATLVYPAFFTFLSRIPMIGEYTIGGYIARYFLSEGPDWALRTLAGIAGGAFVGVGVGVTYHGGGSTGGLDVLSVFIAKKTPIKEAVSAFIIDAVLVIVGIFVAKDVVNGVVGVIGAFVCAIAVQYTYVNAAAFIIADIISSEYESIKDYVENTMDRTTTVIEATGGYTGEGRKILRVAFAKRELIAFRSYIASVDPRAFVTFTQASMINGEGFDPLVTGHKKDKAGDDGRA